MVAGPAELRAPGERAPGGPGRGGQGAPVDLAARAPRAQLGRAAGPRGPQHVPAPLAAAAAVPSRHGHDHDDDDGPDHEVPVDGGQRRAAPTAAAEAAQRQLRPGGEAGRRRGAQEDQPRGPEARLDGRGRGHDRGHPHQDGRHRGPGRQARRGLRLTLAPTPPPPL